MYIEPHWLMLTGKMHARLNNIQQAERLLQVISATMNQENRMDKAAYHILKGEVALVKGEKREAVELFEIAYKLRSDNYNLESLAYGYFISGDFDRALEMYEKIINDKSLG